MSTKKCVWVIAVFAGILGFCGPVWADGKSVTIRVSCTILPMIEMTTPQTAAIIPQASAQAPQRQLLGLEGSSKAVVGINSNLSGRHCLSQAMRQGPEGLVKVYSVTAA